MEFYDFPYIGNEISPTDELIFFRGVGIQPTRYVFVVGILSTREYHGITNPPGLQLLLRYSCWLSGCVDTSVFWHVESRFFLIAKQSGQSFG